MSLATFIFPAKSQTKIANITIDAAISIPESNSATITNNPIESGFSIADSIYYQPLRVSITGRISDYDVNRQLNIAKRNFFGQKGKTISNAIYYELKAVYKSCIPFQIVTSRRIYENMLFTSFNIQVDGSTSQALAFTAEAQEILFAKLTIIKIPRDQIAEFPPHAKDQQQSSVDKGTQPANAKEELRRKSILASIADGSLQYLNKF